MAKKKKFIVQGHEVRLYVQQEQGYMCIADIAKNFETGVAAIDL